jgi:hypothetical protein
MRADAVGIRLIAYVSPVTRPNHYAICPPLSDFSTTASVQRRNAWAAAVATSPRSFEIGGLPRRWIAFESRIT